MKTRTYSDLQKVEPAFKKILSLFRSALKKIPYKTAPHAYLKENEVDIPPIKSPERWWSEGNLCQLTCLRKIVASFETEPFVLDLIKMGVLGILVQVSNAKHNHVSITFAKKPLPTVEVADALDEQFQKMLSDLNFAVAQESAEVKIYQGNSKFLTKILPTKPKVTAVITSPPYPNRFSYARETRPHLFFFDFIESAQAVGQLETDAIGGTWGKATSVLSRGISPQNNVIDNVLDPYLHDIHSNGDIMANYVVKYFNNLYDHAEEISKVCHSKARLAYVIGNSMFYGQPLPSDEILASIFVHFGFQLEGIERMRKRQSKSGLYESVVFMKR